MALEFWKFDGFWVDIAHLHGFKRGAKMTPSITHPRGELCPETIPFTSQHQNAPFFGFSGRGVAFQWIHGLQPPVLPRL